MPTEIFLNTETNNKVQVYRKKSPPGFSMSGEHFVDIPNLQFPISYGNRDIPRYISVSLFAPDSRNDTAGPESWLGISINGDDPISNERAARFTTALAGQSIFVFFEIHQQLEVSHTIVEAKCRVHNGGVLTIDRPVVMTVTIFPEGTIAEL
jgi:hypothetical protein